MRLFLLAAALFLALAALLPSSSLAATKYPTKRPTKFPTSKFPTKAPTSFPTTGFPTTRAPTIPLKYCRPMKGVTNKQCRNKINKCGAVNAPMKWGASSCINSVGNSANDGGCHCDGYCGYTCRARCVDDDQCKWIGSNEAGSRCVNKQTNEPQPAISSCLL